MNNNTNITISGILPDRVYTAQELLKLLPVSKSHLYKCLKSHNVPKIAMAKRYLYLGVDILKFLQSIKEGGE